MVPRSIRARVRHEHGHWGIVVVVNGPGSTFHLPCFLAFTASQSPVKATAQLSVSGWSKNPGLQTTNSSDQCPVCHPWILAARLCLS